MRYFKNSVFLLLCFLFVGVMPLYASSADDVLQKSKAWFKTGTSWSLDFDVKVYPAGSPDVSQQKGSLLVGEKNKFRLSVSGITFISDGVSLWQWNIEQRQVLIKSTGGKWSSPQVGGVIFKSLS
jgi:outer membrane lipoprotein-sorting protein